MLREDVEIDEDRREEDHEEFDAGHDKSYKESEEGEIMADNELKGKDVVYFEMHCEDFENFVMQYYGLDECDSCAMEDAKNRVAIIHRDVEANGNTEYDEEEIEEMIATKGKKLPTWGATILNDLCKKGVIKPGNYLINFNW